MLVGDVIKLCNLVSKVPVCMADQAKLLVTALQCKSSVKYTKLKQNKVDARRRVHWCTGGFSVPGIGWPSRAPDWLIPRWMMRSGCNLRYCLRTQSAYLLSGWNATQHALTAIKSLNYLQKAHTFLSCIMNWNALYFCNINIF